MALPILAAAALFAPRPAGAMIPRDTFRPPLDPAQITQPYFTQNAAVAPLTDSSQVPEYVLVVVECEGSLYGIVCRNDPVNNIDPLGLDYVSVEGGNVYWNVEEDNFFYNPDVNRFLIGSVADGTVAFDQAFGGGSASLDVLKKYANRFWDRPVSGSVMDPTDISSISADVQRGIVEDYLQHYVRDYGCATLSEYRGPFASKVDRRLDAAQTGLDVAGCADPTFICDGINAIGYKIRGKNDEAALSAVAMFPYLGDILGKGGKLAARYGDDAYAGVKEASRILKERGVPRRYRKEILESFDRRTIEVLDAGEADFALRYFDDLPNGAPARGHYLFESFPATRQSLALPPDWNQILGIKQWRQRPGSTYLRGRAASQGPYYPGGQYQRYIFDTDLDLLAP